MGWLRSLAAVAACGVLLAGCSDDEPDGQPSPSPSVSTTAPVSPTPSAAPAKEPVLPAAARQPTEAGARAFIAYYWEVVNYAQTTGDLARLTSLASRTCDVCSGVVSDLRRLYASGGRIDGGTNVARVVAVTHLNTKAALGYRLDLDVSHGGQTIVKHDGSSEKRGPGSDRFTAYLLWVQSTRWRLDVMELK